MTTPEWSCAQFYSNSINFANNKLALHNKKSQRCAGEVHRMAVTSEDVMVRMKKNVLSCFGHVERMSDENMAKKIYDGKVTGNRGRGRPKDMCRDRSVCLG